MPVLAATPGTVISVAAAGFAVYQICQFTKFIVADIVGANNPSQNRWVQLYVLLVSLAVVGVLDWANNALATRADFLQWLSDAVAVAIFAIAAYHLTATGDNGSPTPAPVPPAPPA